jgi:diguanylate cyclase (GGDEF)-like protein/PAS domain S-box-containing protein
MKKLKLPDISEKSIAIILEIISDGVWDWNANTGDVYRSPGWYIMLGYDVDSLEGSVFSWENVIHPDDYARVMEHFESYITHQIDHYKIRYRCRTKAGDYINIEDRARIVEWNPDGTVARMIGAHHNIDSEIKIHTQQTLENKTLQELVDLQTRELLEVNSQLSKLNDESKRLATTDFLTSLVNRYGFEQKLSNEIDRVKRFFQPLSLIAFDLDNFKPINDNYGHAAGDLVLKNIAIILQSNLREIDTLARWGGDEFMLLLPHTSIDQAEKLAEKIQQFINEEMSKQNLSVTASFGVAELKKSETPTRFINRADNAMYDSKKLGGNKITTS